ncbi:MAG: hypothetical protein KAI85_10120 [Halopseudomonas aestusnigri]|nr:hypothetical protein [Halopseudomonas aestusnigri]
MISLNLDLAHLDNALRELDDDFRALTAEAKRLASEFLEIGAEKKVILPLVITVTEDKRFCSTSIRWSLVEYTFSKGKRKALHKRLRKGRDTHKYSESTFDGIEDEFRSAALVYEEKLAVLRYALARNRAAASQIGVTKKGIARLMGVL